MQGKYQYLINPFLRRIKLLRSNLNLAKTLKLVWSVEKKWTSYNVIMIVIETGLLFTSLYCLKLLIDSISKTAGDLAAHKNEILFNIFIAGLSAVLYVIAKAISSYVTEKQSARVAEYLDDKIHESAINLDLSFYESPEYFDILKRAKDAGSDRPALLIKTLSEILKNSLTFIAVAVILITIDWLLIPILFIIVLPLLIIHLKFSDTLNMWRIKQTPVERQAIYLGDLITSDTAAKEIRSYRLGHHFRSLYLKIRLSLLSQRLNISFKRTKNEIFSAALASIGFFGCITYIALKTLNGQTTIGDITLFLVLFPQSFNLMQNLSSGISIVYQNNIFMNSIFDLFDLKNNIQEKENPERIPGMVPLNLEMKNVCFTYPHCTGPALSNINLKIPAGKIIGIVGLNGAGKTTLIKLLSRLYDVNSGHINLNGTDIRNFKIEDYRKQVSIVFQDYVKYKFTVKENISFGDIDSVLVDEDIRKASVKAGSDDFIRHFTEGYNAMMGRIFADGHEISIGQWQKLAIARAFYSHSSILIFDEATSSLDAIAEKTLFDDLRENMGNRSALIISHRHSAIRHADYIYVLSDGKIVQSGTDRELLFEEGIYSQLFNKSKGVSEFIL